MPPFDKLLGPEQPGEEVEFPWYIPVFSAVIPVAIGLQVAMDRHVFRPPRVEALLVLIAVTPFVLDAVSVAVPIRLGLPEWMFSVVVIAPCAILLLHPTDTDFVPFLMVFLAGEMGSRLRPSRSLIVAALGIAVMASIELSGIFNGSFIWIVGIMFGWSAGFAMRQQIRLTNRMKSEQESLAERYAAAERQRIAREIHDVIAHSMSVTMLHITAARMALERDRSADALEALREAEQQGRNSLDEIRRTVGLLGAEEAASAPPLPTATDLPELVADFQNAGLEVELSMIGAVIDLPPAAGLNVYRIVQESLTNVVKHAPGAKATVGLVVSDSEIRLRVSNGAANGYQRPMRSGGGLGMRGMKERAEQMGGNVDVLVGENGWTVQLVAPRATT